LTQLLTEMDGIEDRKKVFIIGCTNRKDVLDSALLRPGRLDHQIFVDLPTESDRVEILKVVTKEMGMFEKLDLKELAKSMTGYSCSKIVQYCNEYAIENLKF
jgi:ATP-dependent 26S proteasome regulatory subunit